MIGICSPQTVAVVLGPYWGNRWNNCSNYKLSTNIISSVDFESFVFSIKKKNRCSLKKYEINTILL
jgi:hypothetical protein